MHLVSGQISFFLSILMLIVSAVVCMSALRRVKQGGLREGQVPLLGVGAGFVLLLQLIPLPLANSLGGHLCGALLLSMLLGPWAACLIIAAVVIVQQLFAQGSIITIGANIFTLGIVAGIGGYYILNFFKSLFPHTRRGFLTAAASASWCSLVFSVLTADLLLIMSGRGDIIEQFSLIKRAAYMGIGEAAITSGIVFLLLAARPDLVTAYCCGNEKDVCYEHHHHKHHHHPH